MKVQRFHSEAPANHLPVGMTDLSLFYVLYLPLVVNVKQTTDLSRGTSESQSAQNLVGLHDFTLRAVC